MNQRAQELHLGRQCRADGTTEHVVGLPGIVPEGIFKDCTLQSQPAAGAGHTGSASARRKAARRL